MKKRPTYDVIVGEVFFANPDKWIGVANFGRAMFGSNYRKDVAYFYHSICNAISEFRYHFYENKKDGTGQFPSHIVVSQRNVGWKLTKDPDEQIIEVKRMGKQTIRVVDRTSVIADTANSLKLPPSAKRFSTAIRSNLKQLRPVCKAINGEIDKLVEQTE